MSNGNPFTFEKTPLPMGLKSEVTRSVGQRNRATEASVKSEHAVISVSL